MAVRAPEQRTTSTCGWTSRTCAGRVRRTFTHGDHNGDRSVRISFGYNAGALSRGKLEPVEWDTERLINGHVFLVGKSGSGKTYTLRQMVQQIAHQGGRRVLVHVFDVHGDIDIEGASSVRFSEATPYGFNPLIINPDPHFGGVRKRIQSFIGALARAGYAVGTKQEAVLRHLLTDLYAANGFRDDRPETWKSRGPDGTLRKQPTVDDAVRYASYKLKSMYLGSGSKTVAALEGLYRKQAQLYSKAKRLGKVADATELNELRESIQRDAATAEDLFHTHLETMQTGHEMEDLIKYDNRDVMKSVVERLENLRSTGVFRPERPPFDPAARIWRYDIKALSAAEKRLFTSFLLEAIYLNAMQRGPQDGLIEVVVLDEAHMFFNGDPENPINIIAKEARKFGLGLFCASQSPLHFSDDFLSNVGTKIILGIDEMFWDQSIRKLRVKQEALEWIISQKRILVQMNTSSAGRSKFLHVVTDPSVGAGALQENGA